MNHTTCHSTSEVDATYRMGFTVGDHSARHMRRILRLFLTQWELTALADAAELALTELVANVVRHVPGRDCVVLILRQPDGLRVEVSDGCPAPPRVAREAGGGELSESGRGMLLVEAVADRWGTDPKPTGKTVWFECDAPGPADS
ncbi:MULTISPECIES: ATP-binding protein [unclassified Streptomyces]|uniref:ATP-binding protein n=1 Tax=unclassified Streptomyces TaxID=2593676 RepID=UPI001EF7B172|nr:MULTISPECIES: ATP-binding protein [unclassified Streptomyces]